MANNDFRFKAKMVQLILKKETDEAIKILSHHYKIDTPRLKVGMPKKSSRNAGCYVPKTKTIHVADRKKLADPFVILHEFYHHLRTHGREHLGTEKHADKFAEEFIEAYQTFHKYSFNVSYDYQKLGE
jgi:hypothetical protein